MQGVRVAIDGPAGAGKSTIASRLSKELGYYHLNTGTLYRAITLAIIDEMFGGQMGSSTLVTLTRDLEARSSRVSSIVDDFEITIRDRADGRRLIYKGEDVTARLRSKEVDGLVGVVSKYPFIREKIGSIQKDIVNSYHGGIIVEGRDIGTVIMPNAEVKIFLVADVEERAKRRMEEYRHGTEVELSEIIKSMRERDYLDETREVGPLKKADDAVVIDNGRSTIDETVHKIEKIVRKRENK